MTAPLVSVVVPTRNRPSLLAHALASISAQEDLPASSVEAVVVNDGGGDVTAELETAQAAGLRVRAAILPERRGLPTARNLGIDTAQGALLAFLDDDDVFLPHHLRTVLEILDGGQVDAAYTTCLVSPVRVDPTKPVTTALLANSYPFDPHLLSVANFIPVHSAVIRRPSSSTARFDPELTALEDWDMWLRLARQHGYRFAHVAEPTVVYHRIPTQASMCGATVSDAAALADFGTLVQRLWRHWPATSAKAVRFRSYLGVMYWHALSLLAHGGLLADLYFQRCLGVLHAAWTGIDPEQELIDRLHQAVQADPEVTDVT